MSQSTSDIDFQNLRNRLLGESGPQYWRSLEQLANTPAFQETVRREFAFDGPPRPNGVTRRDFLSLVAASIALAGLTGCEPPREAIVPYIRRPEDILPGKPLFFATACPLGAFVTGVLVKSHMGRPIKVEGNPDHPASLGAIGPIEQASILSLYDPDRSQVIQHLGRPSTWDAFLTAMLTKIEAFRLCGGKGLHILSEPIVSPTLADQRKRLLRAFPEAKWHRYTPINRDAAREGAILAFGRDVQPRYDFEHADVILSLDSDFLVSGPGHLRYARQFAAGRRVTKPADAGGAVTMNRLYAAECTPTLTGAAADHRLSLDPLQLHTLAAAIAGAITGRAASHGDLPAAAKRWVRAVADDLQQCSGRAVVVVGDQQPAAMHALGYVMNEAVGAFDHTITFTEPTESEPENQADAIGRLASAMERGEVDTLLLFGGNPVYDAPADLRFAEHMSNVALRVHVGEYQDETARLCHWHVPLAHYLEAWSDSRAFDGTISIMQPLIAPLYGGKSLHEVVAVLLGEHGTSGESIVRAFHEREHGAEGFERFWNKTLHDGVMICTASAPLNVTCRNSLDEVRGWLDIEAEDGGDRRTQQGESLHLLIRPDATMWDGRFANNGWLQELPKPLTKLTWDNAALISPTLAQQRALQNGDVVELSMDERVVRAPVWILPGQPAGCVTVHPGHGRTRAGRVGSHIGFDAYPLRTPRAPWGGRCTLRKTGDRTELACTQDHHSMEGRHPILDGVLSQFQKDPHFAQERSHETDQSESLFPAHAYDGYAWGMAIDLNTCIGCNACMIACQSENNIPIVGADEVRNGREMHWIRVDRYFAGGIDDPATRFQPLPCMQCEDAPCELVCPVGATVHSSEGLNDMVYNRCVGTRYCSNNCPYKVRRFNFYEYADFHTPSLKLLHNPDVTVRSRGVMEKCTYCVQRINLARIDAQKERRSIRDGEVVTACQGACPTQAIVFGDINDPDSKVSRLKRSPLNYTLLAELNTRPRTTYLAKLTNPNPAFGAESGSG